MDQNNIDDVIVKSREDKMNGTLSLVFISVYYFQNSDASGATLKSIHTPDTIYEFINSINSSGGIVRGVHIDHKRIKNK